MYVLKKGRMIMDRIAVIGAGVMGRGIVQTLAQNNYQVHLIDRSMDIVKDAYASIEKNLHLSMMFIKDKNIYIKEIMRKIHLFDCLSCVSETDIIIENVTEDISIKEELFTKLSTLCSEESIVLVNTSCISITRLASLMKKPENVIGTHFMNPVPMIAAVEVIKGYHTSEETIKKTIKLLSSINKKAIMVNDMPGFVSNRISHLMMNEAAFIVQDGIASPENVDAIFKECYGHKMGPLETADLIGLDTVVRSLDVLYDAYHDSKFKCSPLLRKMVDAGLYGYKSGQGFYEY